MPDHFATPIEIAYACGAPNMDMKYLKKGFQPLYYCRGKDKPQRGWDM